MEHLVLYDGVCGLCNRLSQFILKRDRLDRFHFVSRVRSPQIYSDVANAIRMTSTPCTYLPITVSRPNAFSAKVERWMSYTSSSPNTGTAVRPDKLWMSLGPGPTPAAPGPALPPGPELDPDIAGEPARHEVEERL